MSFPSPNVSTDVLRTIHRIHRQLADLKQRRERGPARIRTAEANVEHCERQLEAAADATKKAQVANNEKQQQFDATENKIQELKLKLNSASSNREYQALKEQIAADDMTNSVLADEILEGFDNVDELKRQVAEVQRVLQKSRQKAAEVHKEVDELLPHLGADLARLQAELKEHEAAMPAEVKELYDRVVRQRDEDALAVIEGEYYCSGCHTQVPLNVVSQIKLAHPKFCKSCGRLLYMPESSSPARSDDE